MKDQVLKQLSQMIQKSIASKKYMKQKSITISNQEQILQYDKYYGKFRSEIDPRDQEIIQPFNFSVNSLTGSYSHDKIIQTSEYKQIVKELHYYLSSMCENVASISFKLLNQNKLTENETKDFAAKNILGNVESILTKIINQIRNIINKQDVEKFAYQLTQQIDETLMQVMKSLSSYYPQAPPAGNTAKMREVIVNVNRTQDQTTDMIYNLGIKIDKYIRRKSWDSGQILTSYEEYTGFIMEVINATIEVTRQTATEKAEQTVFQKFVEFSERLFCTSQHKYYKILMNKILKKQTSNQNEDQNDVIIKYFKKILSGQEMQQDQNWAIQALQQKLDLVKGFFSFLGPKKDMKKLSKRQYLQTIKSQYEEELQKMKKSHKHAVSQKIPAYVKPFSRNDLKENNFFVNNSSILRIMTKWAQKLQEIFTKSQLFIKQREYYFKNMKNELIPPSENLKNILHQRLANQYKTVKKQFAILKDKNTLLQSYFLTQSKYDSQNSYLSRYTNERCTASKINATLIQSMRCYLCILIHHLLRAGSDIQVGSKKQHINLIIFQVNDLLRSKFQCNETTFINILNTIYQLDKSSEMKDKFKLVRVKNKLDQKDNNILINYMILGKVQCQLQLSIQQSKTKEKNYYNFSHFAYELTRGKFGAITQCAIIVSQHDPVVNSSTNGKFYKPKKSHKLQRQKRVQKDAIQFQRVCMKDSNLFVCFGCKNFVISDNKYLFEDLDNKCNSCIMKLNNPEIFIKNERIKDFLIQKVNKHIKKITSYGQVQQGNYVLMLMCHGNKKDAIKIFRAWYHPREFKLFLIQIDNAILSHVVDESFDQQEFNYFNLKKDKGLTQLTYTLEEKHFIELSQLLSFQKEALANMNTLLRKFENYRVQKNLRKAIADKTEIIDLSGDELKLAQFQKIIDARSNKQSKQKKRNNIQFANLKSINIDKLGLQTLPINLQGLRNLTRVNIEENRLKTLNLSNITNLNNLDASSNQLQQIDLSKNTQLVAVDIGDNHLKQFDASKNISLADLTLQKNLLTQIFLQTCTQLVHLDVSKNKLANIDVSQNPHLKLLHLGNNNITTIDLSQNSSLQQINLNSNKIKYIDLSKNTQLKSLNLSGNGLTSIDLTNNVNLNNVYLQSNQLTLIDLSKNVNLVNLTLYKNKITEIYLTKNTKLNSLFLYNNQLTEIDLTKNVALCSLNLYNNRIRQVDLSKNTNLMALDLSYNHLWAISLHRNTKLISLDLRSNQLPSLDLSSNVQLMNVSIQLNKLQTISFAFNKQFNLAAVDYRNQMSDKCNIFIYYDKSDEQLCQQLIKKLNSSVNNKKCKFLLITKN